MYITSEGHRLKLVKDFIEWLSQSPIPITEDAYEISFYASASQDFWFFAFIGLIVSIPSIRNPNKDSLRTKIMHIYSDLDERHAYMPYLEKVLDRHSCIISNYQRKVTFTQRGSAFLEVDYDITTQLKNIHKNIELKNTVFGKLSTTPDRKVFEQYPENWGELISFKDSEGNHLYPRTVFSGRKFELQPYKVNLKPNQTKNYHTLVRVIIDPKEKSDFTLGKFVQKGELIFLNQTGQNIRVIVHILPAGGNMLSRCVGEVIVNKDQEMVMHLASMMPEDKVSLNYELQNV